MFNVYNTYANSHFNIITGLEMLNDNSFIVPYFTITNFFWFKSEDILILILYIIFTTSVALSVLKLIYDINLKFQIAIHITCFFHEIINLLIVVFITF